MTDIVHLLKAAGQEHLFPEDSSPQDLQRLTDQLHALNDAFPGGVVDYVHRARRLLASAKDNCTPFAQYVPRCPRGVSLTAGECAFREMEELGQKHGHRLAFCLVAGGLGERLGFPGIKVSLPLNGVDPETCYLEYYFRMIKTISGDNGQCPLAIMTSDDTHRSTLALLEAHNYFGAPVESVTLMKQQKVPALSDSDGHIAVSPADRFSVLTKPHGHGDVHVLLHQHGLPKKWLEEGRTHLLIFQDTNALVAHAVMPMLGVSLKHDFVMNSLGISRKPGEAVGAICELVPKSSAPPGTPPLTINVEYNYLEAMLGDSDAPGEDGCSPFPGNANVLLLQLEGYSRVLQRSSGIVPEFVNPKYQAGSRTQFKTPTRLECLMQDLPRLFEPSEKVGVTTLQRWLAFSTIKNNSTDAAAKSAAGINPEAPFSAEADLFHCNVAMLKLAAQAAGCADVKIADPRIEEWLGIRYPISPAVIIAPQFALTLSQLTERLTNCTKLHIAENAVLVLKHPGVQLRSLELDGYKVYDEPVVVAEVVQNAGLRRCPVAQDDEQVPLHARIRGYLYRPADEK